MSDNRVIKVKMTEETHYSGYTCKDCFLINNMKSRDLKEDLKSNGGEEGIWTLDTLWTYTRFPGVLLQPLGHLTKARVILSFFFMIARKKVKNFSWLSEKCVFCTLYSHSVSFVTENLSRLFGIANFFLKKFVLGIANEYVLC